MDLKQLNDIKTPTNWIDETLDLKAPKKNLAKTRPAVIIMISCLIIAMLTIGVSAMTLPTFFEWLSAQFEENIKITKFIGYEVTPNGFFIKDGDVNYFDGNKLTKLSEKRISGTKIYNDERYSFSFDYVIQDGEIYTKNQSKNIVKITSFDENNAIIWLDLGTLWNSYFINLETGDLTPIVEEEDDFAKGGKLKLAIDVEVSENQKYLLYRSNRYTSKTDGNKGEWFLREVATGAETRLEKVPAELFSDEIGFIGESSLAIAYNENLCPMVFNCETNEYKVFDRVEGSEFGNSFIYQIGYEEGAYIFKDIYTDKTYELQSDRCDNIVVATREMICLMSPQGEANLYLINQDKAISFQNDMLSGIIEINDARMIRGDVYLSVAPNETYVIPDCD